MTASSTIITNRTVALASTALVLVVSTSGTSALSALGDGDCSTIVSSFKDGTVINTIECADPNCVALDPLWRTEVCAARHSVAQSGIASVEEVDLDLIARLCDEDVCAKDETTSDATAMQADAFEPVAQDVAVSGGFFGDDDAQLLEWSCVWNGEIVSYSVTNLTDADQLVSWEGTPIFGEVEVPAGAMIVVGIEVNRVLTVESRTLSAASERTGATTFEGAVATIVADTCPWDLNDDDLINPSDLILLLGAWGTDPGGPPDFNGDGVVNPTDLIELLGNWGPCPK